jgi:hypothetical protein
VERVTGNLWSVLGIRPLLGRVFTEDEDRRSVPLAVISYALWQRRFGASRDVLGRKITLNDSAYEVIGVMPRDFYFLPARDIEIWMPASYSAGRLRNFGWHDEHCVARLKPGVTLEQARQSMKALSLQVTANLNPPRAAVSCSAAGGTGGQDPNIADRAALRVRGGAADLVCQSGKSADVARDCPIAGSGGTRGAGCWTN